MAFNPEIPPELRDADGKEGNHERSEYTPPSESEQRANRTRQAKAWSIAMDPVYGLIGMGLLGYGIDYWAGTGKVWTITLAIAGLVGGFYLFIKEATKLNKEQTRSSTRTDGDRNT